MSINNMTPFQVATMINTTTAYMASTVKMEIGEIDRDTSKVKKIFRWTADDKELDKYVTCHPKEEHNALYIKATAYNQIMVIDIDEYPIGDYIKKLEPFLPPNIWIDYTISGGAHIYFRWDSYLHVFEKKINVYLRGARIDVLTHFHCICGTSNVGEYGYRWDTERNPLKIKHLDSPPNKLHYDLMLALAERQLSPDEVYGIDPEPVHEDYEPNPERLSDGTYHNTCVICLDHTYIDYVPNPCGHRSYCEGCMKRIKKCGLCKAKITNWVKVFE
jgi:hypothetical protein